MPLNRFFKDQFLIFFPALLRDNWNKTNPNIIIIYNLVSIYMCVCVCVCVCKLYSAILYIV